MASKQRGLMTSGVIWKELLLFSIPLLLGNLFQLLYNTVDSIVVGNFVGHQALAAVGASTPLINMLIGFFMGVAAGAGVLVSRFFGARKLEELHIAVHTFVAFTFLFGVLMMLWVQLFAISYLRVYWDHYQAGIEERITIIEVFRVMLKKFGVYLVWSVFCGLVVFIGFLFLFVPGIYIGISFTFGSYLLILRDNGLGKIITESMAMVKGNWWKTFGFILVMYLLVGVVAYLFGIPYMFVMMSSAFTGAIPNIYEITFSLLLSYLGQYTLYTVLFVGVGMLFFSRSEEMEHTTLLSQIDQLGVQPEKKADEEAN